MCYTLQNITELSINVHRNPRKITEFFGGRFCGYLDYVYNWDCSSSLQRLLKIYLNPHVANFRNQRLWKQSLQPTRHLPSPGCRPRAPFEGPIRLSPCPRPALRARRARCARPPLSRNPCKPPTNPVPPSIPARSAEPSRTQSSSKWRSRSKPETKTSPPRRSSARASHLRPPYRQSRRKSTSLKRASKLRSRLWNSRSAM